MCNPKPHPSKCTCATKRGCACSMEVSVPRNYQAISWNNSATLWVKWDRLCHPLVYEGHLPDNSVIHQFRCCFRVDEMADGKCLLKNLDADYICSDQYNHDRFSFTTPTVSSLNIYTQLLFHWQTKFFFSSITYKKPDTSSLFTFTSEIERKTKDKAKFLHNTFSLFDDAIYEMKNNTWQMEFLLKLWFFVVGVYHNACQVLALKEVTLIGFNSYDCSDFLLLISDL